MKTVEIDPELVERNLSELSSTLAKVQDPALIEEFFYSLLTKSEADEIAKRWALVKDLAAGVSQREIARKYHLSLCKITRGSRELKKPGSAFKRMLELAGVPVVPKKATTETSGRG